MSFAGIAMLAGVMAVLGLPYLPGFKIYLLGLSALLVARLYARW